jgi:hypothetical protein
LLGHINNECFVMAEVPPEVISAKRILKAVVAFGMRSGQSHPVCAVRASIDQEGIQPQDSDAAFNYAMNQYWRLPSMNSP